MLFFSVEKITKLKNSDFEILSRDRQLRLLLKNRSEPFRDNNNNNNFHVALKYRDDIPRGIVKSYRQMKRSP